jgi:steroid 5-alpha reductase family enzyme|tara:strand:- start:293 stop:1192 length:900 start_codon:yes stop_codon:yes gene_type:complete
MDSTRQDLRLTTIVVTSVFIIVFLMVSAVGNNSVVLNEYSVVLYCAAICIGIQWVAWIPASVGKTERFYDLTGGLTYLTVVGFSLWAGSQSEPPSLRELIVSLLVVIWSLRLSFFLYLRIHRTGKDGRFDQLKTSPIRFLVPWTLQGLWVFLTMIVVIVINSQADSAPALGIWDGIGLSIWILGFGIETIADNQKKAFNTEPNNQGKWIDSGLWSYSRHPNYLGEILLWTGIAFFGISCFTGLERVAWISPIFIYLLLTKVSGTPILDKRALEKWGDDPEYQKYRDNTPALIPRLFKKS